MLAGSARPVPARCRAVPWSTEVRTSGRPSVTLTPCPKLAYFFFFQAEDGIRYATVTGVQTCALPISTSACSRRHRDERRREQALVGRAELVEGGTGRDQQQPGPTDGARLPGRPEVPAREVADDDKRSEERRVGKEWRARRAQER